RTFSFETFCVYSFILKASAEKYSSDKRDNKRCGGNQNDAAGIHVASLRNKKLYKTCELFILFPLNNYAKYEENIEYKKILDFWGIAKYNESCKSYNTSFFKTDGK
ncbi:MAG: hypothetical protein DIU81_003825, partial [[Clostridium] cellulosi]